MENIAAPGTATPMHFHAEDEIFHILEGTVTFSIDGDVFNASVGSIVVIPAGAHHAWRNRSNAPIRMSTFFSPGGVEELYPKLVGLSLEELSTVVEPYVNDFDRASPEVVVDFALMEVSRDKAHTLGISPPTSASVQLQSNISTSSSNSSSTSTGTSSSSSSSGTGISLNSLANLNATDFAATISSANATALFTDSSTKIIQNPQIRSVNGQKASLKIGERVPVATGSYQSGISGLSVSGLVNTQFQYIDVGVNIDITPHIHPDGDVTLKISLDVSSVINNQPIGGITEPVIGQRKVEHEIRLKDGEVSLLGGMLEQQNMQTLTGIPGLSQIPILKYLFGQ